MTRTGDREIRSVSGRLPDNAGELACMQPTPIRHSLGLQVIVSPEFYQCASQRAMRAKGQAM